MFLILFPRQLIFLHDREPVGLTAGFTRKGSTQAGGDYRRIRRCRGATCPFCSCRRSCSGSGGGVSLTPRRLLVASDELLTKLLINSPGERGGASDGRC